MTTELSPPCIYVKDTGTTKGRGVFAGRVFRRGEIVEQAPVVLINMAFIFLPNEIKSVTYNWPTDEPHVHAFALGYGSLYNHDDPANLRYRTDPQNGIMHYTASRDIAAGEELTIDYNQDRDPDKKDWFATHNITPILSQEQS